MRHQLPVTAVAAAAAAATAFYALPTTGTFRRRMLHITRVMSMHENKLQEQRSMHELRNGPMHDCLINMSMSLYRATHTHTHTIYCQNKVYTVQYRI